MVDLPHSIETDKYTASLLEDGIIHNHVKEAQVVDVETAWAMKRSNLELAAGKSYSVLVTAGYLSEVTREARELIASEAYQMNTLAKAIVVNSIGQKIVVNFYLTINKPKIRTHLFTQQEKAIAWLKELKEQAKT